MFTRNRGLKASTFGALIVAGLIVFQGVSAAHHPEIQATPQCLSGTTARITVTTSAWATPEPDHRVNTNVQLTIGNQTFSGAFNAGNGYQFSVTLDVPANGATYAARATAVAPWGPNGEFGSAGEFRETTVTAPPECLVAPTTSTTSTTSTTVPTTTLPPTTPSSTVAPTTEAVATTAAPTTIAVQVGGIIEERVNVLARTGSPVTPLLVIGLSFVIVGAVVELRARRRRPA